MSTHPKTESATPRLDAIEEKQRLIHDLLTHIVNGRQTSEEHDPFIHVVAGDEKWNICLSRFAKWVAGIAATVIAAAMIAALAFAWNGAVNMTLMLERLDKIEQRLDRLGKYITRVDARLDGKVDKQ